MIMPRTIVELKSNNNEKNETLIQFLLEESDFEKVDDNGEIIYVNTKFDAYACFKYVFEDNRLIMEGWAKTFPMAPISRKKFKEHELKGFSAGAPKKICRKLMEAIEKGIE